MRRRWTDDEVSRLQAMVAAGCDGGQITAALQRSRGSVGGQMQRLGLEIAPEAAERAYREALKTRRPATRPIGIRPSLETRRKRSDSMKAVIAAYPPEKLERLQQARRRKRTLNERQKISQSKLPDLPEHLMSDYRVLVYSKRYRRAEAIEMLRADHQRLRANPDLARIEGARRGSAELLARIQKLQQREAAPC